MMQTVLGSAIGGLVAGVVVLGAAQMRAPAEPQFAMDPGMVYATPVANPGMMSAPRPGRSYYAPTAANTAVYADDMVVMPRARTVSRPVERERVIYRPADEDVRRDSGRSWKKTAMIIGGSAGAGAGIGALVRGKKGALIGAAIGGGAATIYESAKR